MDFTRVNPQWIWIASAIAVVLVVILLVGALRRSAARRHVRPLAAADRERFRADWRRIEQRFVDRPATAVGEAEELVAEVMRAGGLGEKHPRVASGLRSGRKIRSRHARGRATTEEMRQALLEYRAIFVDLVGAQTDVAQEISTASDRAEPRVVTRNEGREEERLSP